MKCVQEGKEETIEKMGERCEKADVNEAGGGRALRAEEGGCRAVVLRGVLPPGGWVGVLDGGLVAHSRAPEPDKQRHFSFAMA